MAFGARTRELLGHVLREGMTLVVIGVAFGLVCVVAAPRDPDESDEHSQTAIAKTKTPP
jgi:hypothetical protein